MVKLGITAETDVSVSTESMLDAATAVLEARESMLALGHDLGELQQVCDNIAFIKNTIETNGVQWYIDNCDPNNEFAHMFGVQGKLKENWVKAADAATEGLLGSIWDKIVEWWNRFVAWVKGIFGSKEKAAAENVEAAVETKKKADAAPAEKKAAAEKTIKEAPVKKSGGSKFISGCKTIWHKIVDRKNKSSTEALTDEKVNAFKGDMPTLKCMSIIVDQAVPRVMATCKDGLRQAEALIPKLKTCKSAVDVVNLGKDLEASMSMQFAAMEKEFGPVIESGIINAGDDGTVTLGQIGVNNGNDIDNYVNKLSKVVGCIRESKNIMTSWVDKLQNEVKNLHGDQFDEINKEVAQFARALAGEAGPIAVALSAMEEMCLGLTQMGREMEEAKLRNIEAAA